MPDATNTQIDIFRKQYCLCHKNRTNINNDFDVSIESFEKLLPGNTVRSYATGSKPIKEGFIIFKAIDKSADISYYPVFSESVGRRLAKEWNIKLPPKMAVLIDKEKGISGSSISGTGSKRKIDNQKMLLLIQFARSLMILHVKSPSPIKDPFRLIFNKLSTHPNYNVFESDVKSINTAIKNFLHCSTNTSNENFNNLQQYIDYLEANYPKQKLRDHDFEILREKMRSKYPNEMIVF